MPSRKSGKGMLSNALSAVKSAVVKVAKAAIAEAKNRRVLSGALKAANYPNAARFAHAHGFGKKKRSAKRGRGPVLGTIAGAIGGLMPGWGKRRRKRGRGEPVTSENAKVLIM